MWTLQPLADARSVLTPLPDIVVEGKPARGLRVGGSIEPAMSVYFDATTHDLLKIEWRGEQFHFSTPLAVDGTRVPSRCVLIGKSGRERMRTELHEITRLAALPDPARPDNRRCSRRIRRGRIARRATMLRRAGFALRGFLACVVPPCSTTPRSA